MKLFNVIIIHDVYVAAESHEDARNAAKAYIAEEGSKPTEETALEARSANNIRESWRDQPPFVGSAVSDEDFEKLKGKTTEQIYELLYASKAPKKAAAAK